MARSSSRFILLSTAVALALGCPLGDANAASMDWKAYARSSLTPDFSWAADEGQAQIGAQAVRNPLVDLHAAGLRLAFSVESSQFDVVKQHLSRSSLPGYAPRALFSPSAWSPASRHLLAASFEADQFAPSLNASLAGVVDASVGVVVASQRFATAGFGLSSFDAHDQAMIGSGRSELSTGQGMHVGFSGLARSDWQWAVSAQTQIDMDAFKSYRGVYSEPGDFDVPGRVSAQMAWSPGNRFELAASVDRVFYSDVQAFTSGALPARFLALLGDSSSPNFAWQDLTVFAVEGTLHDAHDGQWSLRYTTRQQPSPTSPLLDLALAEDYTDLNLAAAYRRSFDAFGQLALGASYAPSQYFLGVSPYGRSYQPGRQLEVELNWTVNF